MFLKEILSEMGLAKIKLDAKRLEVNRKSIQKETKVQNLRNMIELQNYIDMDNFLEMAIHQRESEKLFTIFSVEQDPNEAEPDLPLPTELSELRACQVDSDEKFGTDRNQDEEDFPISIGENNQLAMKLRPFKQPENLTPAAKKDSEKKVPSHASGCMKFIPINTKLVRRLVNEKIVITPRKKNTLPVESMFPIPVCENKQVSAHRQSLTSNLRLSQSQKLTRDPQQNSQATSHVSNHFSINASRPVTSSQKTLPFAKEVPVSASEFFRRLDNKTKKQTLIQPRHSVVLANGKEPSNPGCMKLVPVNGNATQQQSCQKVTG